MGRDVTADKTPLLMNAEQNIGNSATLQPASGAPTCTPATNPPRIIQLSGGSCVGQTTSVVVTASRIVGPQNPNPGVPGPITGVVEFGNGGRFTRAEFDVPIGPFVGRLTAAASATEPQDGGTIITVPTGVLRVYCRYDNLLIQPLVGQTLPESRAQATGVLFYGPGGPLPSGTPSEPVLVKAMAAYFSRHYTKAYKTLYCYVSDPAAPIAINLANTTRYCLPAFAQSLKVLRWPVSTNLIVTLFDSIRTVDEISVPAGTSPIIPIVGTETIVRITSVGPADNVSFLALSCEIGI
jgi:hypothetical protein